MWGTGREEGPQPSSGIFASRRTKAQSASMLWLLWESYGAASCFGCLSRLCGEKGLPGWSGGES